MTACRAFHRTHLLQLVSSFLVWHVYMTCSPYPRGHVNCLPCMQRRSCKSTGRVHIRSVFGTRPIEPEPKFVLENCFSPRAGVSHDSVPLLSRFISSPNSAMMSHLGTRDNFASALHWALGILWNTQCKHFSHSCALSSLLLNSSQVYFLSS